MPPLRTLRTPAAEVTRRRRSSSRAAQWTKSQSLLPIWQTFSSHPGVLQRVIGMPLQPKHAHKFMDSLLPVLIAPPIVPAPPQGSRVALLEEITAMLAANAPAAALATAGVPVTSESSTHHATVGSSSRLICCGVEPKASSGPSAAPPK